MLAVEREPSLTQTGATTPLGRLLRCYWLPVAVAAELTEEQPIRPLRVLSEELVLFVSTVGRAGLIQARCPHGGYPLELGSVEETGIVCARHGWHFDLEGNCFVVNYTGTVYPMAWAHARTYPVQAHAGLLWAYLGPMPAPPLPDHPLLVGSPRLGGGGVLDLPWLAARGDGGPALLLPADDTHTWRVALALKVESSGAADSAEALQKALLHAIARIEAGEEPAAVARKLAHPLIIAGDD